MLKEKKKKMTQVKTFGYSTAGFRPDSEGKKPTTLRPKGARAYGYLLETVARGYRPMRRLSTRKRSWRRACVVREFNTESVLGRWARGSLYRHSDRVVFRHSRETDLRRCGSRVWARSDRFGVTAEFQSSMQTIRYFSNGPRTKLVGKYLYAGVAFTRVNGVFFFCRHARQPNPSTGFTTIR